ncbi:MAG: hypothetical protein JWM11_6789, partial [Planctomycetaceae bacterium]|nr:hypothetical protein [Planctomycetaceae bacterium]
HYFTKARHFWDPSWCARDPFLQSAHAHYVFYATFGLLTRVFTFDQSAWIGRLIGWGLLASGWCAVASRICSARWFGLCSAWIFLGLATIGNWSGEWVIGGIEAKVISYACAWWSLASFFRKDPTESALTSTTAGWWNFMTRFVDHRMQAAAWAGAAVSFHPVVGIWHTGALVLAAISIEGFRGTFGNLRSWIAAGATWIVLSAPGLIPAIAMIRDANPDDAYAADYIQVYHRLNHHLDPLKFRADSYVYYGILIALVVLSQIVTRFRRSASTAEKLLFRYVMIAVSVALAGLLLRASPKIAQWLLTANAFPTLRDTLSAVIQYENRLPKWLKFYPFRLADVAVPMAFAIQSATWMLGESAATTQSGTTLTVWQRSWGLIPYALIGLIGIGTVIGSLNAAKSDTRLSPELFADWRDVCHWLRRETPADALCYVPAQGFGLKWYAERPEYVSHKDCPQDAAGIVAWNQRFRYIVKWSSQQNGEGYSRQMIRQLHQKTGIDYVITPTIGSKLAPFPIEPIYQNPSYLVFRLEDAL